jgi:hypothetical protein
VNPVRGFALDSSDIVTVLPSDSAPIDLVVEPTFLRTVSTPEPLPPPISWTEYVSRLPVWARGLLQDVTFVLPIEQCHDLLQHAPILLLASNGGALPYHGSFGYLLAIPNEVLLPLVVEPSAQILAHSAPKHTGC